MLCLTHLLCSPFGSLWTAFTKSKCSTCWIREISMTTLEQEVFELPTATTVLPYFHDKWLGCISSKSKNNDSRVGQCWGFCLTRQRPTPTKIDLPNPNKIHILTTTKYYLPINDTHFIDESRQKYNHVLNMSHMFVLRCSMRSMPSQWHQKMQMCRQWRSQIHCMESTYQKRLQMASQICSNPDAHFCGWSENLVGTVG